MAFLRSVSANGQDEVAITYGAAGNEMGSAWQAELTV
jgi:hypothetical protein